MESEPNSDNTSHYEDAVREIMSASGVSRAEAESIAAIEFGMSKGCLIAVDEDEADSH